MKDLTKKNIAVKVTAKNVNSLKKLFDMFPNEVFAARLSEIKEGNFIYINGFNQWVSVSPKYADVLGIGITLIGSKQLRTILAKEHLKVGDVVVEAASDKGAKVGEVDPVGKWCKFWDDDDEDEMICKYGKPSGLVSHPHQDSAGWRWRYYSVLPDNFQELLNTL